MVSISAFILFALLTLAGSRYEQLQGDLLEEKNARLTKLLVKQGAIIEKYQQLLKEFSSNDNE